MFSTNFDRVCEIDRLKAAAKHIAISTHPGYTLECKVQRVRDWLLALHGNVGAATTEKCVEYIEKWNNELKS